MYSINIVPEPEVFNGKPMYFWSIMAQSGTNRYNCGHGWSESVVKAAEDAEKYYQDVVKKMV